jgi:hypothetical protein
MTRRELTQQVAGRDRSAFESAIGNLVAAGQVEHDTITYQGRAGTRYRATTT